MLGNGVRAWECGRAPGRRPCLGTRACSGAAPCAGTRPYAGGTRLYARAPAVRGRAVVPRGTGTRGFERAVPGHLGPGERYRDRADRVGGIRPPGRREPAGAPDRQRSRGPRPEPGVSRGGVQTRRQGHQRPQSRTEGVEITVGEGAQGAGHVRLLEEPCLRETLPGQGRRVQMGDPLVRRVLPALQQPEIGELGDQGADVVRLHQQGLGRLPDGDALVLLHEEQQGELAVGEPGVRELPRDPPFQTPVQRGQARHEHGGHMVDVLGGRVLGRRTGAGHAGSVGTTI
ncbi:hypothetical protein GA0115249_11722 [Streptomyces sp. PpalLS-921]|nr:hypothetical protein GA0115249_11722 [Streptomyces sp. PpalLS-921]